MSGRNMIITGGVLCFIWGIFHLMPTANVVRGFGAISPDNMRVIAMEWINEGLTLIFIGALAVFTALNDKNRSNSAKIVYELVFIMLLCMSVVSIFTGFGVNFLPYKLCPLIFMVSGCLILFGSMAGKKSGI
jgi:hypothetical protein